MNTHEKDVCTAFEFLFNQFFPNYTLTIHKSKSLYRSEVHNKIELEAVDKFAIEAPSLTELSKVLFPRMAENRVFVHKLLYQEILEHINELRLIVEDEMRQHSIEILDDYHE